MNSNLMIPDFPHNIRDSQQGRDLATSGCNRQKFQLGQSYIMWKVWHHQIWIQNNLGFLVLILIYILKPTLKDQYIRVHMYNRAKCIFNKSNKKNLTFLWLTNFISLNSLKALLAWVTFWKGRLSFLIATFCCVTVS